MVTESAGLVACNISPAMKVPELNCWVVEALSVKLALGAKAKAFEVLVDIFVHPVLVQLFPMARRYSSCRLYTEELPPTRDVMRIRKLVFLAIFVTLVLVATIHVAVLSEPLSFLNPKET